MSLRRLALERPGADVLPVAKHRHGPAQAEHFGQAMRHVDEGDAAAAELLEDGEEVVHLGVGERGGRLVQDEDLAVERERPGDLEQLLLRRAEARHRRRGIDVAGADGRAVSADRACMARRSTNQPRRTSWPAKMFSATSRFGKSSVSWWTRPMPAASAARGSARSDGLPVAQQPPGVGPVDAGRDLHERALAGAVLAHQGVRVARRHRQGDATQRLDAAEGLAHVLECQRTHADGHRIRTEDGGGRTEGRRTEDGTDEGRRRGPIGPVRACSTP